MDVSKMQNELGRMVSKARHILNYEIVNKEENEQVVIFLQEFIREFGNANQIEVDNVYFNTIEYAIEYEINRLFDKACIQKYHNGAKYLREIIKLGIIDETQIKHITQNGYKKVAEKYEVHSLANIERSIRYTKKICIKKCSNEALQELFHVSFKERKNLNVTNRTFIYILVEYVRNSLKQKGYI